MTLLARALLWIASLAITLPLAGLLGAAAIVGLTLPGGDHAATVPGLSAPASIAIDADGIPRIAAANADDAAAALGYAHARERMFQMDLMRRAASGTLSELAGPATLRIDRLMRTLGLRRQAEADFAGLDAETRSVLSAYAAGVNAWIGERGRRAALEFVALGPPAPWVPVDSLLWGKTMAVYLSGNWRTELARLSLLGRLDQARIDALWPASAPASRPEARLDPRLPALAARLSDALPTFPDPFTLPSSASNAWAVDGRHSVSGAPLLAGDPHLAFGLPGFWYLARMEFAGEVMAGATAPGLPFLVLGHNGHVAWSFTTTGADTQDLFIETPAGHDLYLTPDGPQPIVSREERIHVRGHPDEVLRVRTTRHGPIISDIVDPAGPMLALAAANLQPGDTAAAGLLALDRARDVDEAGRAAARITAPVQNMVVADHSRIALFLTGQVPVRRAGDGAWPQAGADGGHDWVGMASGLDLPHVVAPPSGRLVNANERVAPADFPVFLGRDWFGDFRARRIREMLGDGTHGPAEFAGMQTDVIDRLALDLLPTLRLTTPRDAASKSALDLLREWDGTTAIDQPQPLIFVAWMRRFVAQVLERMAPHIDAGGAASPWPEIAAHALATHDCFGNCDDALADSLAGAMVELTARFGAQPAAWRWGAAHEAVFAHPMLGAIPWIGAAVEARIASPGGETTVYRGGLRDGSYDSVHGAGFRAVYDLSALDRSLFVVAPGQSGHVASPHARDFVRRWRDGTAVMLGPYAQTRVRITLSPGGKP